jgi:hypothetical protein
MWGGVVGSIYLIATAFKTSNDDTAFITELRDNLVPSASGWVDRTDRKNIRKAILDLQAKANDTKAASR